MRVKHKYQNMFMHFAVTASLQSTSNKRKVGAVVIRDNNCISIGWNGTLPGHDNACEDCNNRTKPSVIHAEENAIVALAGTSSSTKGGSLFVTTAPCFVCSRLIIKSGILEVFYLDDYKNNDGIDNLVKSNITIIKMTNENGKYIPERLINKRRPE